MYVQMDLARIVYSETADQQIIVLVERSGSRQFPIVIGSSEALAIDRRVKGYKPPRPMTHDLVASVIDSLSGTLDRVLVNDLQDHTFYAKLVIRHDGELVEVDSRPSDAIALGVATDTPIFVAEHVLSAVC